MTADSKFDGPLEALIIFRLRILSYESVNGVQGVYLHDQVPLSKLPFQMHFWSPWNCLKSFLGVQKEHETIQMCLRSCKISETALRKRISKPKT